MTIHSTSTRLSLDPLSSVQPKRPRRHDFLRWLQYVLALVLLLATFYLVWLDAFAPRWLCIVDEGQWLYYADALCRGQVLYRDVWYQFGPLLLYPLTAVWSIFGETLAIARAYFWGLNVLGLVVGGLALAYLTRSILLMAFGLFLLECNALICRAVMINPAFLIRQCFPLLAIILACNGFQSGRRCILWLAGLAGGTSLLLSQETGLFALAALALAALMRGFYWTSGITANGSTATSSAASSDKETRIKAIIRLYLPILGGILVPMAVWSIYALFQGFLSAYLTTTFLDTFIMVNVHQSASLPNLNALLADDSLIQGWFFLTYLPCIIYASGVLLVWRRWRVRRDASLLMVLVFAALCWSINLGRSDIAHAAFGAGPAIIFGLALLVRNHDRMSLTWKSWRKTPGPNLRTPGRVLVILCLGIMLWSGGDRMLLFFNMAFCNGEVISNEFPLSGGAYTSKQQADRILGVTEAVLANSTQQDKLFVMSHDPMYYFFTQRKNATRFACPIFANRDCYRDEIVADLKGDPPRCIILNKGMRVGGIDYQYYFERIFPLLRKYRLVKQVDKIEIWCYADSDT